MPGGTGDAPSFARRGEAEVRAGRPAEALAMAFRREPCRGGIPREHRPVSGAAAPRGTDWPGGAKPCSCGGPCSSRYLRVEECGFYERHEGKGAERRAAAREEQSSEGRTP